MILPDTFEPRSAGGARNVLEAIHDSIRTIAEQPYGSVRTSDPGIRMKVEPRYRSKIFYRIIDSDIVQIVHMWRRSRRLWSVER
jgi:plasmid stabilization system protein ParE